ncbi:hypothetical protein ACSS6W_008685 [Trichoderma asperelloides]
MTTKTILEIGGTGAQGVPVVQGLSRHGYHVRVLARDENSEHSNKLRDIVPNVQFVTGRPTDETAPHSAFTGVEYAFHYVWSSLDDYALETKFDGALRCGHYYGKGHVKRWMSSLPQSLMKWSVVCTGPYIEQLWNFKHPKKQESGVYDFGIPIGDGAFPYVFLDDLGYYVW